MQRFLIVVCLYSSVLGKSQVISFPSTIDAERQKLEQTLQQKIAHTLTLPLDPQHEADWLEAFWAMELMQLKNNTIEQAIRTQVLSRYEKLNLEAKRQALETIFALYPLAFAPDLGKLLPQEKNPKLFAMMVHYLHAIEKGKPWHQQVDNLLKKNLLNYVDHPILYCLKKDLEQTRFKRLSQRPPLSDLLKHPFPGAPWVLFSFQRLNRDYPGMTLIRRPDGQFVHDSTGQLFMVPQLARAVSNLPGYITNGNTPQGVLSILEITTTDNLYIGPNDMLNMVLPYEVPLGRFSHQLTFASSEEATYQRMLPASWQHYFPIWEAYYAGKAGRTEIFAHGTTINPKFYAGAPYFPNTPSLGCLTASETWNLQTGQLEKSDQLVLIQMMKKQGISNGYFVVVETDDQPRALHRAEIEKWIKELKEK